MTDSGAFAQDLHLAERYSHMLLDTCRRVRADAVTRMGVPENQLPAGF